MVYYYEFGFDFSLLFVVNGWFGVCFEIVDFLGFCALVWLLVFMGCCLLFKICFAFCVCLLCWGLLIVCGCFCCVYLFWFTILAGFDCIGLLSVLCLICLLDLDLLFVLCLHLPLCLLG